MQPKGDVIAVTIGGEPFTEYHTSDAMPKPFFSPVRGPGGTVMTRPIEKQGDDHPHHKGIWLAVDKVNGVAFWAERGRIENRSATILQKKGKPAKLRVVNDWLGPNGQPILTETTVIGVYANRLVAYDISFSALGKPVTFGDTKEGLFGFRMVDSMREKEGGHVVNAQGLEGTGACWGKTSAWVDYTGEVNGNHLGVAIFDHPLNVRPSRYHVRNYGLFSISPFGERAYTNGSRPADPVTIAAGKTLRLRYAMYIHAGDAQAANVDGVYRKYLENAE
jgi:hypothetical protein